MTKSAKTSIELSLDQKEMGVAIRDYARAAFKNSKQPFPAEVQVTIAVDEDGKFHATIRGYLN